MTKTTKRRMMAEWEPQSMVQLTWPHKDTDWAPILPEITSVYEEMAREIAKRESLLIVAPEGLTSHLSPLTSYLLTLTSNDTWARDHGFISVEDNGNLILLDFCFNGWGEKFEAAFDNAINRHLYDQELVRGTYENHLDFVLEGGSIESDGKGTVFTTTCCLMAPHRNQPLTQAQIEDRLKQYLGAERIVWINHGSLIGDDTDGHIDTLVRICPDDTLLYIGADADHPDLLAMEGELRTLRTFDGRPYRLLRLPLPRPIYDGGDRPRRRGSPHHRPRLSRPRNRPHRLPSRHPPARLSPLLHHAILLRTWKKNTPIVWSARFLFVYLHPELSNN